MEHIANPTDVALQQAVESELAAALGADAPLVGVSTKHGVVTLSGDLPTEAERTIADAATEKVWGVHAVADDIGVPGASGGGASDTEIADAAQKALQHDESLLLDSVFAEVRDKVVTLTGTVSSPRQRLVAERVITYVPGVLDIRNHIVVAGGSIPAAD